MSRSYPYRKLWESRFGPIPVDENGVSYEIHHIDGDHTNNDLSNLKCVSIEEHLRIHDQQGDIGACVAIRNRMKMDPKEKSRIISELTTKRNLKLVEENKHQFQSKEWREKYHNAKNKERVENGVHNFLGESNPTYKRISEGSHNWQQAKGTVPCVDKNGKYLRVSKDVYDSQEGDKSSWEYVHNTSLEGKKRLSLLS